MNSEADDYQDYLTKFHPEQAVSSNGTPAAPPVQVLGIDLGSSSLRLALSSPSSPPSIVEDREGKRSTPAYVYFEGGEPQEDGTNAVLGTLALQNLHQKPKEVLSPWSLLSSPSPTSSDTSAAGLVLKPVVVNALEKKSAGSITAIEAVLSYSPSFTQPQKDALSTAAGVAGLVDPYFVCEPVGAVIASAFHGVITEEEKGKHVMVVDFGHAITSFSIVKEDTVVSTASVPLAGEFLSSLLVSHLAAKFEKSTGLHVLSDLPAVQRLHDAAGEAIVEMSKKGRADVDIPYITADADGPKHLNESVSVAVLSSLADDNVGDVIDGDCGGFGRNVAGVVAANVTDTLTTAGITPMDLAAVVLVGGASRSPVYFNAVSKAVGMMGGEQWGEKVLRRPEGVLAEEITVVGAVMSLR